MERVIKRSWVYIVMTLMVVVMVGFTGARAQAANEVITIDSFGQTTQTVHMTYVPGEETPRRFDIRNATGEDITLRLKSNVVRDAGSTLSYGPIVSMPGGYTSKVAESKNYSWDLYDERKIRWKTVRRPADCGSRSIT